MKKLMIIVPNLRGGGQERIAACTSKLLEDLYDVYFLTFSGNDDKYEISSKAKRININVPESSSNVKRIINVLRRTVLVKKFKQTCKIDIAISFGKSANLINTLSKKCEKCVVSQRNSSRLELNKKNIINRWIFGKADEITFVSKGQRNQFLETFKKYEKKCHVLYNPCDVENIQNMKRYESSLEMNDYTLVSCGRLEDIKCYKNLINAIKMARSSVEELQLIIIGSGNKEVEIREHIRRNNAEEYIQLIPFMYNPFSIISKARAFVFSSSSEGFPNVICEALACKKAIISTDCSNGPREILADNDGYGLKGNFALEEYGILVPTFIEGIDNQPKEEEIFAQAIIYLINNLDLQTIYQNKAIERAEYFSTKKYLERLMEIIQ